MPELPFPITAKDIQSLMSQVQLLFDEIYEERIGGANVGDVFEIGDDDILKVRLASDGGLEKSNNQLKVKPDQTKGITLRSNGIGVKIKGDYGIDVDDDGLKLLKQSAISDASAVSNFSAISGSDSINMADLNSKFSTLVSEINAIKDTLNDLLSKLRAAKIIET